MPIGLEDWFTQTRAVFEADRVRLTCVLGAYAVVTLAELRWPAERGQRAGGRVRNLVYAALLLGLGVPAWTLLASMIVLPAGSPPRSGVGEAILVCVIALLANDAIYYWYHRAQHRWPWLWRVHELHHADASLNITTSMRTYWLELPLQALLIVLPVRWLTMLDSTSSGIYTATTTAFLLFSHANLPVRLGPFTPVLVGPQLHRIHHSIEPRHRDCNFAQIFPIFDIVFGTYRAPRRDEFPPTGTAELPENAPVWRVLVRPFWRRVRGSRTGSP